MAEVQQQQTHRKGRRRPHPIVRIDMTPMVDLAFLLLTFFVLTSELKKENAIATTFPKVGPVTLVNNGLTVLLGKNPEKIYWYRGEFGPSVHLNVITKGNAELLNVLKNANESVFNSVYVIDRQHDLGLLNETNWNKKRAALLNDKSVPFVIVKWNDETNYESVVNTLDDLLKVHDNKYAVVTISDAEKELLKKN